MSSPIEKIKVVCPKCGRTYEDWFRASLNLEIEDFDEEYIDLASSSTCPDCNYKVQHDVLVVREDGVWESDGTSP